MENVIIMKNSNEKSEIEATVEAMAAELAATEFEKIFSFVKQPIDDLNKEYLKKNYIAAFVSGYIFGIFA